MKEISNVFVRAYLNAAEQSLDLSAEAEKKGDMAKAQRLIVESRDYSKKAEMFLK